VCCVCVCVCVVVVVWGGGGESLSGQYRCFVKCQLFGNTRRVAVWGDATRGSVCAAGCNTLSTRHPTPPPGGARLRDGQAHHQAHLRGGREDKQRQGRGRPAQGGVLPRLQRQRRRDPHPRCARVVCAVHVLCMACGNLRAAVLLLHIAAVHMPTARPPCPALPAPPPPNTHKHKPPRVLQPRT
jgi:hypothetical protein